MAHTVPKLAHAGQSSRLAIDAAATDTLITFSDESWPFPIVGTPEAISGFDYRAWPPPDDHGGPSSATSVSDSPDVGDRFELSSEARAIRIGHPASSSPFLLDTLASTPDSPTSFAFSPVASSSFSDADESQPSSSYSSTSEPCTPSTFFPDQLSSTTGSSSKGKARASSIAPDSPTVRPLSLSSASLFPHVMSEGKVLPGNDPVFSSSLHLTRTHEGPVESALNPTVPLSRTRSTSSTSSLSTHSITMPSISGTFRKGKNSIANKLMRRKTLDRPTGPSIPSLTLEHVSVGRESSHTRVHERSALHKSRAYTAPVPLLTQAPEYDAAEDLGNIVDETPASKFDMMLPRELKLAIFSAFLILHEVGHEEEVRQGSWTVIKARRQRYFGRENGLKELLRLGVVSKSWLNLVLDGQIWAKLDLSTFPQMPISAIMRLVRIAGPFIKHVDLRWFPSFHDAGMRVVSRSICSVHLDATTLPCSQLTDLNLQGCSTLSNQVLHDIIVRSPGLKKVSLKGLSIATNVTCVLLGNKCPGLTSLDVSRCRSLDAASIISIFGSQQKHSPLVELRMAGIRNISAAFMNALACGAPLLEVLDLSYSTGLANSDMELFTAWQDGWDVLQNASSALPFQKISLSAREMGYDPSDQTRFYKRVTRLRHLNLSHCRALTDTTCGHLAYSVPLLEIFEMAGIGPQLKDDGLVRLLRTTPLIRRIDLEDSIDITDAVLETLTAEVEEQTRVVTPTPQPGQKLEHLVLSSCAQINGDAILSLIRSCTHLRVLELDGTRAGASVVREFARQTRQRGLLGTEINVSDCRSLPGEQLVRELSSQTRHRRGWRAWEARRLRYQDPEECDESRMIFKSFWTWQAVDAERAARDKKLRAIITSRGDAASDELAELLDGEVLLYRDPADARVAHSRWARTFGRRLSTGDSCVVM